MTDPTTLTTILTCPHCGNADIQRRTGLWVWANQTKDSGIYADVDLQSEPDDYYCAACEEGAGMSVGDLTEVQLPSTLARKLVADQKPILVPATDLDPLREEITRLKLEIDGNEELHRDRLHRAHENYDDAIDQMRGDLLVLASTLSDCLLQLQPTLNEHDHAERAKLVEDMRAKYERN